MGLLLSIDYYNNLEIMGNNPIVPTGSKGRPKGSPNKVTATIKAAFKEAFDEMGGAPALVKWGKENPTDFYKLVSKLIPAEITGADGKPLEILWPLPPTKLDE